MCPWTACSSVQCETNEQSPVTACEQCSRNGRLCGEYSTGDYSIETGSISFDRALHLLDRNPDGGLEPIVSSKRDTLSLITTNNYHAIDPSASDCNIFQTAIRLIRLQVCPPGSAWDQGLAARLRSLTTLERYLYSVLDSSALAWLVELLREWADVHTEGGCEEEIAR
jgi:hypothetical protein